MLYLQTYEWFSKNPKEFRKELSKEEAYNLIEKYLPDFKWSDKPIWKGLRDKDIHLYH